MTKREIHRVKDFFPEGDFACIRCGKLLRFYFNGGELDRKLCCGLDYRTEAQAIDLIVYDEGSKA